MQKFGLAHFLGDVINCRGFKLFWLRLPDPGSQPPTGNSFFVF